MATSVIEFIFYASMIFISDYTSTDNTKHYTLHAFFFPLAQVAVQHNNGEQR